MNENSEIRPNGRALIPFLVFVAFYLGLSLQAGDFYRVPMPIAFIVASAAVCSALSATTAASRGSWRKSARW
ncbi:MAG: hypothetical protein IJT64_00790 [Kiritimatiellae bacterium]|nr:hypothetical protein [Kiritimatiellia bacterium]